MVSSIHQKVRVALLLGVFSWLGCSQANVSLSNLTCAQGACVPGFVCHPEHNLCVPEIAVGCEAQNQICPANTATGDTCFSEDSFLPCGQANNCDGGCRTCTRTEQGLQWSACSLGQCVIGEVETCASCTNNCALQIENATPQCSDDGGSFSCDYAACALGFFDADASRSNGCECEFVGEEISCNGVDEDCSAGDRVETGTDQNCAGCGDSCVDLPGVLASRCGAELSPPRCLIQSCASGLADLDGILSNGCEAACVSTGSEVCDGVDNNCDGEIDNMDPPSINGDCSARFGVAGVQSWTCIAGVCSAQTCNADFHDIDGLGENGCEYSCAGTNGGSETCDGVDNDCDGTVDDVSDVDVDCGASHTGADAVTQWICGDGGACEVTGCAVGKVDLDRDPDNGCEVDCTPSNGGIEICDDQDNDCNGLRDDVPQNTLNSFCTQLIPGAVDVFNWACVQGQCEIGACLNDRFDEDGQASTGCEYACTPSNPGPERCDGEDNDCDGEIDIFDTDLDTVAELNAACRGEFPGAYSVSAWSCPGSCEVAQCNSNFFNLDQQASTGCEYACAPQNPGAELCDGEDNDCNGVIDTEDPALDEVAEVAADCAGRVCTGPCNEVTEWRCNPLGLCEVVACAQDFFDIDQAPVTGCEYFCAPTTPGDELCDTEDNNCDGSVDEGFATGFACGVGDCAGGVTECLPGGTALRCSTEPGGSNNQATPELCDAFDHDCDGNDVNGFSLGLPCGIGACSGGSTECDTNDTSQTRCDSEPGGSNDQSSAELCDATDHDCDGDDLNGFVLGQACGVGDCAGGNTECDTNDTTQTRCDTGPGGSNDLSSAELCDDSDHDCDGDPVNGFNVGQSCGQAQSACAGGQLECLPDGTGTRCDSEPGGSQDQSSPEICDGFDNDCDGNHDEDAPLSAANCACFNNGTPAAQEVCIDGRDDDCNDAIDDNCCSQIPCVLDSECTPGASGGFCADVLGDCQTTACNAQSLDAGFLQAVDFTTLQSFEEETTQGAGRWYCNAALPVTRDGILTTWELFVDNGGSNSEVAQMGVIRCTAGGGGTGPALSGCTKVGLGPVGQQITGNGLHQFPLVGSTQLDGAPPVSTLGIRVQAGDYICADSDPYDIGVDCNGNSTGGGCFGPDFHTQRTTDLDQIVGSFDLLDSNSDGFLMIKAFGLGEGTCTDVQPIADGDFCNVSGGDTCCGGGCVVGDPSPGQCP